MVEALRSGEGSRFEKTEMKKIKTKNQINFWASARLICLPDSSRRINHMPGSHFLQERVYGFSVNSGDSQLAQRGFLFLSQ